MTVTEITDVVKAMPAARAIGDDNFWSRTVPTLLRVVLDEIATAYDFAFTLDKYSTVVTVADQAEYEIEGRNKNLRDIISIRYGDDKDVLTRKTAQEADALQSGGQTLGGVKGWYDFEVNNAGFPVVTLFDTPSTAAVALHVRYRMSGIKIDRFPDDFGFVIARGLIAFVASDNVVQTQHGMSSTQFRLSAEANYQRALRRMVRRYRAGGRDLSLAGRDPHITTANREIANLDRSG